MALPITLKVTEQNGKTQLINLPVEVWQKGAKWKLKCNTTSKITSDIADPDRQKLENDGLFEIC